MECSDVVVYFVAAFGVIFIDNISLFYTRGPVTCIAVHPSGRLALSVGKDRSMRYLFIIINYFINYHRTWDLSTGRCAFIKKFPQGTLVGVVIDCSSSS